MGAIGDPKIGEGWLFRRMVWICSRLMRPMGEGRLYCASTFEKDCFPPQISGFLTFLTCTPYPHYLGT